MIVVVVIMLVVIKHPYYENVIVMVIKISNKGKEMVDYMIKLPCTGKEMVDYIADYLENIRDRRVFPEVDKIIALDDH